MGAARGDGPAAAGGRSTAEAGPTVALRSYMRISQEMYTGGFGDLKFHKNRTAHKQTLSSAIPAAAGRDRDVITPGCAKTVTL